MPTVAIDGEEPEAILDIKDDSRTDDIGSSIIVVGDTPFNRQSFESGDQVVIERAGGDKWTGYLTGKPSSTSDGTIEIKAMDSRYKLKERFEIADTSYQAIEKGSSMVVDWPPADFTGEFVVHQKEIDSSGMVSLGLGVRT